MEKEILRMLADSWLWISSGSLFGSIILFLFIIIMYGAKQNHLLREEGLRIFSSKKHREIIYIGGIKYLEEIKPKILHLSLSILSCATSFSWSLKETIISFLLLAINIILYIKAKKDLKKFTIFTKKAKN